MMPAFGLPIASVHDQEPVKPMRAAKSAAPSARSTQPGASPQTPAHTQNAAAPGTTQERAPLCESIRRRLNHVRLDRLKRSAGCAPPHARTHATEHIASSGALKWTCWRARMAYEQTPETHKACGAAHGRRVPLNTSVGALELGHDLPGARPPRSDSESEGAAMPGRCRSHPAPEGTATF